MELLGYLWEELLGNLAKLLKVLLTELLEKKLLGELLEQILEKLPRVFQEKLLVELLKLLGDLQKRPKEFKKNLPELS